MKWFYQITILIECVEDKKILSCLIILNKGVDEKKTRFACTSFYGSELYEKWEKRKTRYSVEDISIILRLSATNDIFEQPYTRPRIKIATARWRIFRSSSGLNLLKPLNSRRSYIKYLHCTSAHTAAGLLRVYVNASRRAVSRAGDASRRGKP